MTTADRVREIVRTELGCDADAVRSSAQLQQDLGADSMDLLSLTMALEEDFQIEIPDDAAEDLTTVGQVIDYIQTRLAGTAPGPRL